MGRGLKLHQAMDHRYFRRLVSMHKKGHPIWGAGLIYSQSYQALGLFLGGVWAKWFRSWKGSRFRLLPKRAAAVALLEGNRCTWALAIVFCSPTGIRGIMLCPYLFFRTQVSTGLSKL